MDCLPTLKKYFKTLFFLIFVLTDFAKADELTPIRLQLKWKNQFQFAGYYAAKMKGFYKNAGLDVQIKPGGVGISPIAEVKGGRADIGIYDPDVVLQRNGTSPLVALACIMQSSPYVFITLPEKHVLKPTDLIGKYVLSAGDQGWTIFKAILIHEGIKPDLINIIPRKKDSEEIIEDRADAVITYVSTQPQRLRDMGYHPIIIRPVEYGIDFYGDVLFSTKAFAYKDTKTTDAFLEATKKGWEYAFAHEDEMINYILSLPGTKGVLNHHLLKAEAVELRKLIMPDIVGVGHMNLGRWQYMMNIYKETGLLKKNETLKGFLYESPNNESVLKKWIKPAIYGVITLTIILIIISLWNRQLRKKVRLKTVELVKENYQRRRAEILAEQRKEQLELVLKSAKIGMWSFDLVHKKLEFNEQLFEILEIKPEDFKDDMDIFDLIHPDDLEASRLAFQQNLAGTRIGQYLQLRIFKSSGEYVTLLSSSRVTFDEDKNPLEISGVLINIDDIKRKEMDLIKISDELLHSNNELKKFTYITSHNLRGPVMNIKSLFEMINKHQIEGDNKLFIDKIEQSIKKLDITLDDLIDVVSQQKPEYKVFSEIDFKEAVRESLQSIETQIFVSGAKIEFDLAVSKMCYSKKYFESILLNLLTNAIKYKSELRPLQINISTHDQEDFVVFKMEDNGIGIDLNKNGSKIFGLYQRFHPEKDGKGIGLFLIKSHIESLNGRIEVESELDKGTIFTIYFSK